MSDGKNTVKTVEYTQPYIQESLLFETILPITSEKDSKYPTLLSIVPLFAAGERENYTTDQHEGRVYQLPQGRIRRIGAGLDVYDEDTLIAILQLGAEKKVIGPPASMPVALSSINLQQSHSTTVYKESIKIRGAICHKLGR